jgi:ATP-dependent RNA circularization protein (DNA/RNA ligase family)
LTDEQRDRLIDLVATRYLDGMDLRDLERFFFDIQRDYLREYTDEELLETVEDVTDEDEYNEVINEIG